MMAMAGKRRSRRWHRVLGLLSAIPLVWVVITGAVLNHSVDLGLDGVAVRHPLVLRAYGMVPAGEPLVVEVSGRRVVAWDGQVFFRGAVHEIRGVMLGAVADGSDGGIAVASDVGVWRIDGDGSLLEVLDEISLPGFPLTGVAGDGGRAWLENPDGWHRVGEGWLDHEPVAGGAMERQKPVVLSDDALRDELSVAWARGGVPMARVLLDLHAVKFAGAWGRYFYDVVALCTLWLCGTGVVLFFRKPGRAR